VNGSTHIDMSLAAADLVEWKGDRKLLARSAEFPDTVRAVHIDGLGAYVIGKNCAAFCHFNRRRNGEHAIVNVGYNWEMDRSIPDIPLLDRDVIPHPEEWGFPTDDMTRHIEPLSELVETLKNPKTKGTIKADKITFPAAATMADWCQKVIQTLPAAILTADPGVRQNAIDIVAGWALHFVEDCCVPHHAEGLLLKGHSAFEGDVEDEWRNLRGSGEYHELETEWWPMPESIIKKHSLRSICEENAQKAQCSPSKLGCYRWFWRRGWNRLVRQTIGEGYRSAVLTLRRIQEM
jgi:hypothetical protein